MEIDLVIPFHHKDADTLEQAIPYIRKNISHIRTIYIIGPDDPQIPGCRFIPETIFGFRNLIESYYNIYAYRHGWIFQQLIKLLAWRYVEGLSDLYLVWDSDTVPYRPLEFIDQKTGQHLLGWSPDLHKPYFDHISKLCPCLHGKYLSFSGICHHQLYSQKYLKELVAMVEQTHQGMSFESAFLSFLDTKEKSCCSEYELYANFMHVFHPEVIRFRTLKMISTSTLNNFGHRFDVNGPFAFGNDVDMVSFHKYEDHHIEGAV